MRALFIFLLCVCCLTGCGNLEDINETHFLMDTVVTIKAQGKDATKLKESVTTAFTTMQAVDKETNRFAVGKAGLYAINHASSKQALPLSPHLASILTYVYSKPDTAFTVALAPLSDLWLKHKAQGTVPRDEVIRETLKYCGRDKCKLAGSTLILAPCAQLDLGGVAKGYAVDRAYEALASTQSAIINAGGTIRVRGAKKGGAPYLIGVQDPRNTQQIVGTIALLSGEALATSGDYQRYYEVEGKRYHHILDPATGYPAQHYRSVTVLAPDALTADYYSTLLFLLPPQKAALRLSKETNIGALYIDKNGAITCYGKMAKRFNEGRGLRVKG